MGCTQSSERAVGRRVPHGVGATERLHSRAARIHQQSRQSIVLDGAIGIEDGRQLPPKLVVVKHVLPPKLDSSGNLMPEEVVRRTSSSVKTKTVLLGTDDNVIELEYAYWTQRGYYPEDPHKENQDECSISLKFAAGERDAMLAVYDGHGATGHACARFAKVQLPKILAKHVKALRVKKYKAYAQEHNIQKVLLYDPAKWPLLSPEEYKNCCRKAFLECNRAMHEEDSVEDKFSGTTAITVNFHGNTIVVSNVGDSRAVIGHVVDEDPTSGVMSCKLNSSGHDSSSADGASDSGDFSPLAPMSGKLLAIPLSRDQTPYRKDERERVKKHGAAILTIDQMEGLEEMHENWGDMVLGEDVDIHGDPPRLWVEGKDYPGTAFTRSVGDYMAEDIGVTAEPEILTTELTSNDQVLVIASDGIFEFVTNQEVIDLCAECETALHACEKVVKAAYKKWLIHENRTDDITVIICFVSCNRPAVVSGQTGTTEDLVELAKNMYGNKPIRKKPRSSQDTLSTISATTSSIGNGKTANSKFRDEQGTSGRRESQTMNDIFNDISTQGFSVEYKNADVNSEEFTDEEKKMYEEAY